MSKGGPDDAGTLQPAFPPARHPARFVWDFWYLHDPASGVFHVFFLNADPSLVAANQHHFSARVGYARTRDFVDLEWVSTRALEADPASWDDTSIWTGDVVRVADGTLMLYTSRESGVDDGLTQNIGAAFARGSLAAWTRLPSVRIAPASPYEPRSCKGDTSIHAWRDPFLFRHRGRSYLLLAAKTAARGLGRKGAVALLRMRGADVGAWDVLEPLADPGWYSEMEVPQLYRDADERLCLVYSAWAKGDLSPGPRARGGLHVMRFADLRTGLGRTAEREVLADEASGVYACRVVPELGGEIVGFDIESGGIRRTGRRTGFRHLDRDFTWLRVSGEQR